MRKKKIVLHVRKKTGGAAALVGIHFATSVSMYRETLWRKEGNFPCSSQAREDPTRIQDGEVADWQAGTQLFICFLVLLDGKKRAGGGKPACTAAREADWQFAIARTAEPERGILVIYKETLSDLIGDLSLTGARSTGGPGRRRARCIIVVLPGGDGEEENLFGEEIAGRKSRSFFFLQPPFTACSYCGVSVATTGVQKPAS